ncbi:MAG: prephenate dehydratase domain-containing protein, partial [Eggerthella lenta]|nr:prephenate dehydratase domain-containing protein [Eggerthella lenta]
MIAQARITENPDRRIGPMASTEPVFAYLGPAGTYTDEAARAFAARLGIDEPNLFECASFDEVFDCVDRGKCEFGVV